MLYDELTGLENLRYFASLYRSRTASHPRKPCTPPDSTLRCRVLSASIRKECASAPRSPACCCPQPDFCCSTSPSPIWTSASAQQMLALLAGLRAEGRTIILTTHQRDLAAPLADAFVTMQAGSVISVEASKRGAADIQRGGDTMKSSATKTNAARYLDSLGIEYELRDYDLGDEEFSAIAVAEEDRPASRAGLQDPALRHS